MPNRIYILLLVSMLLVIGGCGNGGDETLSSTQIARSQLGPEAMRYLTGTQQELEAGNLAQALALSDSALAHAPELSDAHFLRGRVLYAARQYDAAGTAFRRVLDLDETYDAARFNLGNMAFAQDRFQEALSHYLQILGTEQLDGVTPTELPERVAVSEKTTALIQIARSYTKLGEFEASRLAYELALAVDSTDASVHSDFGVMLRDDGDLSKAIVHARKAIQFEPQNIDHLYFLGALLVQSGEFEDAIPILETVIEQRPWQQGAHFNLGRALVRTGKRAEGEYMLAKADTVQLWQTEIDQQLANLNQDPDQPAAWLALGKAYLEARRYEDAADAFNHILQFLPGHDDARYYLAVVQYKSGDPVRARFLLRSVLRTNPNHGPSKQLLEELALNL